MILRLRSLVVAFAVVVSLLGGALWVSMTWADYRNSIQDNERIAQDLAALLEEHARRTFEATNLILMHVGGQIDEHGFDEVVRSERTWGGIKAMADHLPAVGTIFIADREGRFVLTSLTPGGQPGSVTDRDYFIAHRDEGVATYITPAVLGRVTKKVVFILSRRITAPDGSFGGVVLASISTDYFRSFYERLNLGRMEAKGEIAIYRDDGAILVRNRMTAADIGRTMAGTPLFREHLPAAPAGIFAERSAADGVERLVAYRRVEGLPLVVTAAVDRTDALAEWRERVSWTAALALAMLSSIGGFAWLTLASVRREDEAMGALADANERLEQRVEARTAELSAAKDEAERQSRAKSHFLANVSHELRTPLNAIIGFSELLVSGYPGPLTDKQRQYLETISQSGAHLLRIINDILDLSKISAEKLDLAEQEVHVETLVEACLDIARGRAMGRTMVLEADLPPDLPVLWGDELRLKQMLINLLSNAIKFTPDPAEVRVIAERTADGGLVLAVRDNGIGMAPDEIPRALTMFGQLDNGLARTHEGTGIGLPLVKALADLHGACMDIASAPQKGTTVSLRFPPERVLAPQAVAAD
ncbi:sensor histidine kinase [Azospirillum sp.]|uniref:sensor histidine kinase n=1 Tax=Azospirillum sp. TaxID=34012 RepID=UPI002D671475|nr:ATP-binding protein [Azospirillum sp.]HYD66716.1 ATP-binding protein [Azospirillum sp.]